MEVATQRGAASAAPPSATPAARRPDRAYLLAWARRRCHSTTQSTRRAVDTTTTEGYVAMRLVLVSMRPHMHRSRAADPHVKQTQTRCGGAAPMWPHVGVDATDRCGWCCLLLLLVRIRLLECAVHDMHTASSSSIYCTCRRGAAPRCALTCSAASRLQAALDAVRMPCAQRGVTRSSILVASWLCVCLPGSLLSAACALRLCAAAVCGARNRTRTHLRWLRA